MRDKAGTQVAYALDISQEDIAEYLDKLTFRRRLFGGLNSIDVWKKLKKLDDMYSQLMYRQRVEYEARLMECDRQLQQMQKVTETGTVVGDGDQ